MAPVKAPVDWLLFDPNGVSGGIVQGSRATAGSATHDRITNAIASASADRSKLSGVKFCFQLEGSTLVLHTSRLEMPDPWSVRPIQFFPELVCIHHPLVLIRIRSTDSCSSTEFFVYSFPFRKGASATVIKLPKVVPEIWASKSFGLVHHRSDCENYVVANLQSQFNPKTGHLEVFLHRWWCNHSSWQSEDREMVNLHSSIDMGKWQPDQVITFTEEFGYLLWVDLSQGWIIRCNNPLQKSKAKFDFIWFPHMKRVPQPQTFMSVGCCNGELKLVNIDIPDVNTVYVNIMTFDKWYCSWYETTSFPLKCTDLWAAMKNMPTLQLPSEWNKLKKYIPCFPVLSTYEDNILYLIMARKDNMGAWLLKVNTRSRALVGAAAYPGFSKHKKPPYSCNLWSQE